MTRALALLALLTVTLAPAVAEAQDVLCSEQAFDLSACTDPSDLATCPSLCTDPNDLDTCATLPLPELVDLARQTPTQPILRQLVVLGGAFTGATVSLVTLSASGDSTFLAAGNLLCGPAPAPDPDPGTTRGDGVPGLVGGGTPGLGGGSPGLAGGNPGLIGPNPGISIQR
jgi:hypothetical protein